jgi:hypothetical protein
VNQELLDQRYGRGKSKRRDRNLVIGLGSLLLLAFLAWAIWFTIEDANRVTHRDISYEILDETTASITFEVTRKVGSTVVCDLKVLNQSFAIVGFKSLEIAASDRPAIVLSSQINTTELGVSGLVDSCRSK